MNTDFNASTVAPWGARARGPVACCSSCASTLNRWVMAGFPGKRWELDCCRGGRIGGVLKGAATVGRVDVVLPRGWDPALLREETVGLTRPEAETGWDTLQASEFEETARRAGIVRVEAKAAGPVPAPSRRTAVTEPEASSDEESFGLLPTFHFAKG